MLSNAILARTDWHSAVMEGSFEKADCAEVTEQSTLQEQLKAAKDAVAAIEKQLAEEAEKEASRPFTQAEYEAVVNSLSGL